jgi:hypothetical protein
MALTSCGKKTGSNPTPVVNTLLSISDVEQVRDNANATNFNFLINVENPSPKPITVQYATVDGTAKAGTDYTMKLGTLTIPANERYATITVSVKGDSLREDRKIFYLQLSNPTNAKLSGAAKATGTIISDGTYLPVNDAGYKTPSTYPGILYPGAMILMEPH